MAFYYNKSIPEYEYSLVYSMPEKIKNSDHIKFISDYFSNNTIMINQDPIYIRNCIIGIISIHTFYGISDPSIIYYTMQSGANKTCHIGYLKRDTYNITVHEILPDIPEILHINRKLGMIEQIIDADKDMPVLPVIRVGFTVSNA